MAWTADSHYFSVYFKPIEEVFREAARYYETRSAGPIMRCVSQLDRQHNVSIKKEGTMSK